MLQRLESNSYGNTELGLMLKMGRALCSHFITETSKAPSSPRAETGHWPLDSASCVVRIRVTIETGVGFCGGCLEAQGCSSNHQALSTSRTREVGYKKGKILILPWKTEHKYPEEKNHNPEEYLYTDVLGRKELPPENLGLTQPI